MQEFLPAPVQSFIDYILFEKRFSRHTVKSYREDLRFFIGFLQDRYGLDDPLQATTILIRSWMADMAAAGTSSRSINRRLSCLKSFFRHCRKNGLVTINPAERIQVVKTRKKLPSFVGEEQMQDLLNHVEFPDSLDGRTEWLLIRILYLTGLRVSELVSIRERQIDFSHQSLKVLGKGNKERIIPLGPELLGQIRDYCLFKKEQTGESSHDFLLISKSGKPLSVRSVYSIVKRYLGLVTTAEKKSPHVLRHSFATHLTNKGADLNAVKELLGHSSLAATQVYTHNSIEKLRDIHRKAHPKG
jgi:integrase/recombinase XerC